jgi:hypothetical protein
LTNIITFLYNNFVMAEPGSQEIQIPAPIQKKETPVVTPDKAPEKPIVPSGYPTTFEGDEIIPPSKKQWIG